MRLRAAGAKASPPNSSELRKNSGSERRRLQEPLETDVEVDLRRTRCRGGRGWIARRDGGNDVVRELRVVGIDVVDPQDGDLLVRDGEGIPARVERLDQHDVVAPLPGRELAGFVGLCRKHRLLGVSTPAPAASSAASRCRWRNSMGVPENSSTRAATAASVPFHHVLDFGHRGADFGRATDIAGRCPPPGPSPGECGRCSGSRGRSCPRQSSRTCPRGSRTAPAPSHRSPGGTRA